MKYNIIILNTILLMAFGPYSKGKAKFGFVKPYCYKMKRIQGKNIYF